MQWRYKPLFWVWFVVLLILTTTQGCVTPALLRRTVNQSLSVSDMRYQEVLDNLAVMVNNPGVLPSVAVTAGGVVTVSNNFGFDPTTTWTHALRGFSQQVLNLSGAHNPSQQWTIDPVTAEPLVEGLRYAFLWVLIGAPPGGSPEMELLRAPVINEVSGYHLAVADKLARLPSGWLHCGNRLAVPAHACYKAHCGETWVWVEKDGMAGLSEFTLIVLDIATINPSSLVLIPAMASVQYTYNLGEDENQKKYKLTENCPARLGADGKTIEVARPHCAEPQIAQRDFRPPVVPPTPMILRDPGNGTFVPIPATQEQQRILSGW